MARSKRFTGWLANEEMYVFGHHDVAEDIEVVSGSCSFEGFDKELARGNCVEVGPATVATEGDEVIVACSVESL